MGIFMAKLMALLGPPEACKSHQLTERINVLKNKKANVKINPSSIFTIIGNENLNKYIILTKLNNNKFAYTFFKKVFTHYFNFINKYNNNECIILLGETIYDLMIYAYSYCELSDYIKLINEFNNHINNIKYDIILHFYQYENSTPDMYDLKIPYNGLRLYKYVKFKIKTYKYITHKPHMYLYTWFDILNRNDIDIELNNLTTINNINLEDIFYT